MFPVSAPPPQPGPVQHADRVQGDPWRMVAAGRGHSVWQTKGRWRGVRFRYPWFPSGPPPGQPKTALLL